MGSAYGDLTGLSKHESKQRQQQLNRAIQKSAKQLGVPTEFVRYRVAFEGFLERLFAPGEEEWILKGGASLVVRNGAGRTTTDLDLARAARFESIEVLLQEMRAVAARDGRGPLTYHVVSARVKNEGDEARYRTPTYEMSIEAKFGAVTFQRFTLDLTEQRHTQEPHVPVRVTPALNSLMDADLPSFDIRVTAIEGQLADKICAMRELHHSGTSNRFHDLADIVMILLMQPVSAGDLAEKCRHEAQRRGLEVPESLWVPEDFGAGFDRNSNDYFGLPEDFKKFDRAFEYAEKILNPVLNGFLESANWDPQGQEWVD